MNVAKLITEVKKGSPIAAIIGLMKGYFHDKRAAEEIYMHIMVVLEELPMQDYRFESHQLQEVVAVLRKLPPAGARRNFEKLYLQNEKRLTA